MRQLEGASWVTYRVLVDHLGSVRSVVRASDGAVVQRMDYDAFGVVLDDWSASGWVRIPFGFAGGLYDRETGLVRFGAREYDARVGRWVSRDPALFGGGDSNLYRYCGGEPVNIIDVDGRLPVVAVIAIGGAAVWIGWDLGAHLSPYIFASDRVNTSRANAIMNDASVVAAAAGENTAAGIHRVLYSWRSSQEAAHRPYRACSVPLSGPDDIDVVAAEHRATHWVLRDEYTPLGAFGFTAAYDIAKFVLGPLPYLPFVGSIVTGRVSSDDRPPTPYNAFVTHYATN